LQRNLTNNNLILEVEVSISTFFGLLFAEIHYYKQMMGGFLNESPSCLQLKL